MGCSNMKNRSPICIVNGIQITEIPSATLVIDLLRQTLHLTGTKAACREGDCGSCQILVARINSQGNTFIQAEPSCLLRTEDIEEALVLTIEGVNHPQNPVQQTLVECGAIQCGYCTSGLVISLTDWLINGITLTEEEGVEWISANLCRCTGYMGQRRAVKQLSAELSSPLLTSTNRMKTLIERHILPAYLEQLGSLFPHHRKRKDLHKSKPILGGGTDLLLEESLCQLTNNHSTINFNSPAVQQKGEQLWLNAQAPISKIEQELRMLDILPVFSRFCHLFASNPIRNRATLAGNIVHGSPIADGAVLLLALDAHLVTTQRTIPLTLFYTGYKTSNLHKDEIVTDIVILQKHAGAFTHFDKVSRRQRIDLANINCAGNFVLQGDRIIEAHIAMGGIAPSPIRLSSVENLCVNLSIDQLKNTLSINSLLTSLQSSIDPISDIRGSSDYRRLLANKLIESQIDALLQHYQEVVT